MSMIYLVCVSGEGLRKLVMWRVGMLCMFLLMLFDW